MIVEFFREIKFKSVLVDEISKEDASKAKGRKYPTGGTDKVHPEPGRVFGAADEESH